MVNVFASPLMITRLYFLQSMFGLLSLGLIEIWSPCVAVSTVTMSAGSIFSTTSTVFSGVGVGTYFSTLFDAMPL